MYKRLRPDLATTLLLGVLGSAATAADEPTNAAASLPPQVAPVVAATGEPEAVLPPEPKLEISSEGSAGVTCSSCLDCGGLHGHHVARLPLQVPRLGSTMHCHFNTQIVNGLLAQLVLREYDFDQRFRGDRTQLNSAGTRQLLKIARISSTLPGKVTIERSGDLALDQARRQRVLDTLQAMGTGVIPEQVVLAPPSPTGLEGVEAVIIQSRLLNQTRQGGTNQRPNTGFNSSGLSGGLRSQSSSGSGVSSSSSSR